MELTDVIKNRRAVRDYIDAAIDRSTVERLVEAAILAPSAMNLQPWAFAVLLGRERIEGYAMCAKKWLLESLSQTSYEPSIRHMLEDPQFVLFYHAPALVVVLAKHSGTQAAEDCCLAAENLMLAARNEGLGSCWIGFARPWLDLPATKAELNLPEHYHVVAPIVLGLPKAWPDSHGRKPADKRLRSRQRSDGYSAQLLFAKSGSFRLGDTERSCQSELANRRIVKTL